MRETAFQGVETDREREDSAERRIEIVDPEECDVPEPSRSSLGRGVGQVPRGQVAVHHRAVFPRIGEGVVPRPRREIAEHRRFPGSGPLKNGAHEADLPLPFADPGLRRGFRLCPGRRPGFWGVFLAELFVIASPVRLAHAGGRQAGGIAGEELEHPITMAGEQATAGGAADNPFLHFDARAVVRTGEEPRKVREISPRGHRVLHST